jgi:hypothetical protein
LGSGLGAAQIDAQSTVSERTSERLSVIGGDDDVCVESRCRVEKVLRPVRRARQQQK